MANINMLLREGLNSYLDKLACPEVYLFRQSWSAFQVCGFTGLALAILLAMILILHLGLSLWVMAGIILTAVLTFLGLAMATKISTGEERLVYYHHEIAVIGIVALLLHWLYQPVLPYLDVTILGVGLFLVCGRLGCLMVGCCHGQPHRWGVCYREEHATAGFMPYLVGVRLFPIQAIESLWVFCIVFVGSMLVLRGYPSGEALAWYVVTYDLGRFCFEFVRGDPGRPYLWGFSENQWISLLLICMVVWAELTGVLTFHPWHSGATIGLALIMITITLTKRFRKTAKYQLLHPHHVKEIAETLEQVSNLTTERSAAPERNFIPAAITISCTSLGIQISASKIQSRAGCIDHYALSDQNGMMTEETARTLAGLILQLKHASGSQELIKGNQGVFHVLIYPSNEKK